MAIGKASDFKVYQEYLFSGMTETLTQATNAFNAASMNAIRLIPRRLKGDYEYQSFMTSIAAITSRRDTTSTSTASDTALAQDEFVSVKLNRKIGPVANTLDSLRKIASDPQEFSFLLGQQWGKALQVDYLNSALRGLVAALTTATTTYVDKTSASPTTLATEWLPDGFVKLGDAGENISCLVMHSKNYYDLLKDQISDAVYRSNTVKVMEGTPATLGRRVIVTDAAPLIVSGTTNNYWVLGLVEDAAQVLESEERQVVSDLITGLENLVIRIQGEYAFNVAVKGHQWDVSNGGANPTDNALITTTNWDLVATSVKDGPGIAIKVT